MSCQATVSPISGCCCSLCNNLQFKNQEKNKMMFLLEEKLGNNEITARKMCLCALRKKTCNCNFVAVKDA